MPEVDAFTLGMLIALYERAVAIYAEFININAFHQPGVQAYKLAAKGILALREKVMAKLKELGPVEGTAAEIAAKVGEPDQAVEIGGLLDKAAANCPCVSRSFCKKSNAWIYRIG